MINKERISRIGLIAGPALFALAISIPIEGLTFEARVVLATALWMASWWITEAIPIYATALIPLALFPAFNVATFPQLAASYADKIIFLFLGGFILAISIEKVGLHERIALNAIKTFGTNPKSIVGAFVLATGLISAWISNTATALMMLPIAASIIAQVRNENERARFGTCLMLCVAYAASLGGVATLIGTAPNAVFASLSKSLINVDVNFVQWSLIGVPLSAICLAFAWWYMVNFGAKISNEPIAKEKRVILERLRQLGTLTRQEKIVATIFAATVVAWISRGVVWGKFVPMIDDSTIAIIAALALFAIPSGKGERVIDWALTAKIPWGVLLLIGGGLALASGFTLTGLDKWVAERLVPAGTSDILLIILLIVAFTIFSGEIISNTAGAALMIPIGASIATIVGVNPILIMLPIALASSFSFILPVGTPPNAIAYGSGYVTMRQMAKAGFPLDLFSIGIVTLIALLLVPLVFG